MSSAIIFKDPSTPSQGFPNPEHPRSNPKTTDNYQLVSKVLSYNSLKDQILPVKS